MPTLAIFNMKDTFSLNVTQTQLKQVLGGLYGQVELNPNDNDNFIFYIDPVLKHAFPSVGIFDVGCDEGIKVSRKNIIELDFPTENHVTAMKHMLCKGLKSRWDTLYEGQLNALNERGQDGRSMLYSMLQAERNKAMNALQAVLNDRHGIKQGEATVMSNSSQFDGENFRSGQLSPTRSVLLSADERPEGLTKEQLASGLENSNVLYDVCATVPLVVPAPMAPVVGNDSTPATHSDFSETVFISTLTDDDIFPLWSDAVSTINLESVDLTRSQESVIHTERDRNSDVWWFDGDEDEDEDEEETLSLASQRPRH